MTDSTIPGELKSSLKKRLAETIVTSSWLGASALLARYGDTVFDAATRALGKKWLLQKIALLLFSLVYCVVIVIRSRNKKGVLARLQVVKGKGYSIDTLTGENKILRADILHDVGRSLNPAIDRGQIEGGFVQGAGWLTTEELVWDDCGRLLTHAPSTYKIPACSDRPRVLNLALFERGRNSEDTIFSSKAVGEPPLMLAISVFAALSDAVACVADYKMPPAVDAPATPERILAAVMRLQHACKS